MRFVMFYHSLISDWNHGNAHFLRGIVSELGRRGHDVVVYEPRGGWSLRNLVEDQGGSAVEAFYAAYPALQSRFYDLADLDLDERLRGADVVIVARMERSGPGQRAGRTPHRPALSPDVSRHPPPRDRRTAKALLV